MVQFIRKKERKKAYRHQLNNRLKKKKREQLTNKQKPSKLKFSHHIGNVTGVGVQWVVMIRGPRGSNRTEINVQVSYEKDLLLLLPRAKQTHC